MTIYKLDVNGFTIEASYRKEMMQEVIHPILDTLYQLAKRKEERLIVYLVAAPAVGKSTLATFFEYIANKEEGMPSFQSVGLDGFHFSQNYLEKHEIMIEGCRIPMKDVKGCPETFDIDRITNRIKEMKKADITWPIYDRNLHDVVEDQIQVNKQIIMIEGNWLLLDEKKWRELKALCDYSIYIDAEESMLKKRLMDRKIRGGKTRQEAEQFYNRSDSKNIRRVLEKSLEADCELMLTVDGDYKCKKGL